MPCKTRIKEEDLRVKQYRSRHIDGNLHRKHRKERQGEDMNEDKKRDITEIIKNLEQLGPASLRLMKNNAELLLARDAMDAEVKQAG